MDQLEGQSAISNQQSPTITTLQHYPRPLQHYNFSSPFPCPLSSFCRDEGKSLTLPCCRLPSLVLLINHRCFIGYPAVLERGERAQAPPPSPPHLHYSQVRHSYSAPEKGTLLVASDQSQSSPTDMRSLVVAVSSWAGCWLCRVLAAALRCAASILPLLPPPTPPHQHHHPHKPLRLTLTLTSGYQSSLRLLARTRQPHAGIGLQQGRFLPRDQQGGRLRLVRGLQPPHP